MTTPTDKESVAALANAKQVVSVLFERVVREWKEEPANRYADLDLNTVIVRTCVAYHAALSPVQGDGMRDALVKLVAETVNANGDHICPGCFRDPAQHRTDCFVAAALASHPDRSKCFECSTQLQAPICPKCNPEFDISNPDRQPGMTDEQARELLADEMDKALGGHGSITVKDIPHSFEPAIAAIKRASQRQ